MLLPVKITIGAKIFGLESVTFMENSSSKLNLRQIRLVYLPKPGPISKPGVGLWEAKQCIMDYVYKCSHHNQGLAGALWISKAKKCKEDVEIRLWIHLFNATRLAHNKRIFLLDGFTKP